jgi:hypothetical protein
LTSTRVLKMLRPGCGPGPRRCIGRIDVYLKVMVAKCNSLLVEMLGLKLMRLPTRE